MSSKRVVIAALVVAAAVPAPVASATYVENPGPRRADDADTSMQMRVLRDTGAPDAPQAVARAHEAPDSSGGGFPWVDAVVPAGLVALVAAGAGMDRRRRTAAAG